MADARRFSFTKRRLEDLRHAPSGGRVVYTDAHPSAHHLQLRVSATTKTFFVQRRVNGRPQRVTLGRFPDMTVDQARVSAAQISGIIATGGDPLEERQRKELEAKRLGDTFDAYISARTLKPQTVHDIRRCMREVYPDWVTQPLTSISPDMVVERHRRHGEKHSKARANLAMRYLRAVFNYAAAAWGTVDTNPVAKLSALKLWYRIERKRTFIPPHKLGAWVCAALELPNRHHRDLFLFLVLTGARRSEALSLTWDDVDMEALTFTFRDPKNHLDLVLPMSDAVRNIFRNRPAAPNEPVFGRIGNFRYSIEQIAKACGVRATPHDLRRTFITIAESLDIPAYALRRLLNHSDRADVTAGYIVPTPERLRGPMQKVTDFVLKAAELKETATVTPLKSGSTFARDAMTE